MSVGDIINEARVRKRLGLRALARELNIAASYLSDIENDRRVPQRQCFTIWPGCSNWILTI